MKTIGTLTFECGTKGKVTIDDIDRINVEMATTEGDLGVLLMTPDAAQKFGALLFVAAAKAKGEVQ